MNFILPINVPYRFGYRHGQRTWYGTRHKGVDISVPKRTPYFACANGVVETASYSLTDGHRIQINHGEGIKTYQCHFQTLFVRTGQGVTQGQTIALTGNSGTLTTGAHAHWHGLKNNSPFDPLTLIINETQMIIQNLVKQLQGKLNDLLDGKSLIARAHDTGKVYEIKDSKKEEFTSLESLLVRHYVATASQKDLDKIPNK